MASTKLNIPEMALTLQGARNIVAKSTDVFAPLSEAFSNSLEAIKDRFEKDTAFNPYVVISMYLSKPNKLKDVTPDNNDEARLDYLTIEDNGIGFTKENYDRFIDKLADQSKLQNNKGTGKVQFFHRFENIYVDSFFKEDDNTYKKLHLYLSDKKREGTQEPLKSLADNKTVIKMQGFKGNKAEQAIFLQYLEDNGMEIFKRDILKHFILKLWLSARKYQKFSVKLNIFLNSELQSDFTLDQNNIENPDTETSININTQQAEIVYEGDKKSIEWNVVPEGQHTLNVYRFKVPSAEMDENGIYLCGKDIVVSKFKFPEIKNNKEDYSGNRYLTSVCGDVLDKNTTHAMDNFTFKTKKEVEKALNEGTTGDMFNQNNQFVLWDEINDKVSSKLREIYKDVIKIKDENNASIAELAREYGISEEAAKAAGISMSEKLETKVKKLFAAQAKQDAKKNLEIYKEYKKVEDLETNQLDPTSAEYEKQLKESSDKLLEKISQQNKDELARYVIRRNMIVNLLRQALKGELAKQREWEKNPPKTGQQESLIHNVFCRRYTKGAGGNDLWILNEEFVHFSFCSEISLEKIEVDGKKVLQDNIDIEKALQEVGIEKDKYGNPQQRPDVFLYPEEGKCIIIEFKAPGVDMSEHTSQIARYAKLIANYSREPKQFTQFFGFLIGEKISTINLDTSVWKKVPYGNYRVRANQDITKLDETEATIANLYQEMIPLSELANRADRRNRSFAERLGISQKDLAAAEEENQSDAD